MSVPRMRRVAPFDPTQAGGCVLWLDGSDPAGTGIAPANSASVTSWIDKSGSGNNATGGTAPSFTSSSINGRAALLFNGSTAYLNSQDLYSNRSFSIFMIIRRQGSIPGFTGLLSGSSASPNQDMTFAFRNNTDITLGFYYNDLDYASFPDYTGNTSTEPAYLVEGTYTPGTRVLYLNGTQVASDANSTNLGSDPGANIGGNSGQRFNGFIGELIVLNGIPADSSRIQIEGYLAQKWGLKNNLPGGHPGITNTIYPIRNTLSMTPRSYTESFSPISIAGSCLWLDANDPATIIFSTGSNVNQWNDKSGSNNHAVQVSNLYPTYQTTSIYTGKPNILFTATNWSNSSVTGLNVMKTPAGIQNTLSCTVFYVCMGKTPAATQAMRPIFVFKGVYSSTQVYLETFVGKTGISLANPTFSTVSPYSTASNTVYISCAVYDSTASTFTYSINGTSGSVSTGSSTWFATSDIISLGAYYDNGSFQNCAFNGELYEAMIYNSVLTTAQRQNVEGYLAAKWNVQSSLPSDHPYKSAVTRLNLPSALFPTPKTTTGFAPNLSLPSYVNTNGLVSYFLFNGSILDSRQTITLSTTGTVPYVIGRYGNAVSFTNTAGIAPYNYLTSTYAFPSTFTISLWFQAADVSPAQAVVYTNSNPSYVQGSAAIYFAGGNLYCAYGNVANNGAGYAISVNTWYHAVITYNNGTLSLYANGTKSGSDVTGTNSKNGFTLGASTDPGPTYYPFTGYIDDFRIYNRVLSGSEITAIYNGTG